MSVTEILLAGGAWVRVEGDSHDVEAAVLAAARGSLMELAWMIEVDSGRRLGVNPEHVVALRAIDPAPDS